ncbi:MAG: glutamate racemase, partial [Roseovarius sp.]|nr:glutamate racemase [Roseovarius sp.]
MAVGLFDSGLGGLTVWRAIREQLPDVPLVYLGDNAHAPYGVRD